MRYVLLGNFGVGNLGDEALKQYFLSHYPEIEWLIISSHPRRGELPRLPCGVRSFFTPWWKTLRAIRKSDGVVFGGGSLFTDTESMYACLLWWWHGLIARLMGKQIYLAFQGIGPFHTRVGIWFARTTVLHAAFISVRDQASYDRIQSWHLNKKVIQSFDPVISLFKEKKSDSSSKNVFIVIPRKNSDVMFRECLLEQLHDGTFEAVRILSMQPDDPQEKRVCFHLAMLCRRCTENCTVVPVTTLHELIDNVLDAKFVLSHRYHGALAALILGKPLRVCTQSEGDKLDALRQYIDVNDDMSVLFDRIAIGETALKRVLAA